MSQQFPSTLFVDPSSLPPTAYGFIQLVFLMLVYGYILSTSANMIGDGSELLLLIPSLAGIVGSIVLPVLGAVPDGAIVLFSGLGPDAQNQLSVGVGALAGSTIMLLTIPWALCIYTGRVNIVQGAANYRGKPKLSDEGRHSLLGVGVTPRSSIKSNAYIMVATALSYFLIQGAAFGAHCDFGDSSSGSGDCKKDDEHYFALASLLCTLFFFAGYLWYNIKHANDEDREDLIAEVKKQAIESHIISLSTAFDRELTQIFDGEDASLLSESEVDKRFKTTLRSFFRKYDCNGDGVIDKGELRLLLSDLNERVDDDKLTALLREIDSDNSGTINFDEFSVAMQKFVKTGLSSLRTGNTSNIVFQKLSIQSPKDDAPNKEGDGENEDEEEEEEEEEEIPEDIASLPPDQQRTKILIRACWMMGVGTIVTLLFSDPMVDCFAELGARIKIKPFYVAFVLAPIASNVSELIASVNYAKKKTKKTITISLAALEGAACMNNTFCLGIFLCLVFFKGLVWEFSAETISIIFVEFALALVCIFRKTQTNLDAILILSLFPISLVLVWLLENVAGLN